MDFGHDTVTFVTRFFTGQFLPGGALFFSEIFPKGFTEGFTGGVTGHFTGRFTVQLWEDFRKITVMTNTSNHGKSNALVPLGSPSLSLSSL